jgi:hypothetical protein
MRQDYDRKFFGYVNAGGSVLFDDLVGAGEQRLRHGEAERLRGLHIDDQLELGRLLEWKLGGVFAFQHPVDVVGGFSLCGAEVGPIRHQTAQGGELLESGRRREAFMCRKFDDLANVLAYKGIDENKQPLGSL